MRIAKNFFVITEEMAKLIKQKGKMLLASTGLYAVSDVVVKIPVELNIEPVFISNSLAVYLKKGIIKAPFLVYICDNRLVYKEGNFKLSLLLEPANVNMKYTNSVALQFSDGKIDKLFEILDLFTAPKSADRNDFKHIMSFGEGKFLATTGGVAIGVSVDVNLATGLYSYKVAKANSVSIESTYQADTLSSYVNYENLFDSTGYTSKEVTLGYLAKLNWDVVEGVTIVDKKKYPDFTIDKDIAIMFQKLLRLCGDVKAVLFVNAEKNSAIHISFKCKYEFKVIIAKGR